MINLLDFFKSGSFGGVKVGFRRDMVESILGRPDVSIPGASSSDDYKRANLWYYAGVQFSFSHLDEELLIDIGFKPSYVLPDGYYRNPGNENTELDAWIFGRKEPTVQELKQALAQEAIPFQDTGLETCVYNEEKKKFELIPYNPDLEGAEESFGTLVLMSGIQIRYSDDGAITRVASGKDWSVKGREQNIKWS